MGDFKISELDALAATPDDADILAIVDDVVGTPITKKITVANLKSSVTVPVKATGTEINTGTDDAKFVTSKAIEDSNLSFISDTETLTNKRITQRLVTTTDDATAAIDCNSYDIYELSAVADATVFTVTGTPTNGQKLIIRFKDAGTTKGLTWTGFTAIGIILPTTTVVSKWHYVGAIYQSIGTTWQVVAYSVEA